MIVRSKNCCFTYYQIIIIIILHWLRFYLGGWFHWAQCHFESHRPNSPQEIISQSKLSDRVGWKVLLCCFPACTSFSATLVNRCDICSATALFLFCFWVFLICVGVRKWPVWMVVTFEGIVPRLALSPRCGCHSLISLCSLVASCCAVASPTVPDMPTINKSDWLDCKGTAEPTRLSVCFRVLIQLTSLRVPGSGNRHSISLPERNVPFSTFTATLSKWFESVCWRCLFKLINSLSCY